MHGLSVMVTYNTAVSRWQYAATHVCTTTRTTSTNHIANGTGTDIEYVY